MVKSFFSLFVSGVIGERGQKPLPGKSLPELRLKSRFGGFVRGGFCQWIISELQCSLPEAQSNAGSCQKKDIGVKN